VFDPTVLRKLYIEMCDEAEVVPDSTEADYLWLEHAHNIQTLGIVNDETEL